MPVGEGIRDKFQLLAVFRPQLLLVHDKTIPAQVSVEAAITEAPPFARKGSQTCADRAVITAPRPITPPRAISWQDGTRRPLAQLEGLLKMSHGLLPVGGRYHFSTRDLSTFRRQTDLQPGGLVPQRLQLLDLRYLSGCLLGLSARKTSRLKCNACGTH